jgi:DNA-binding NarL/FixJ family response regulator
MGKKILLVSDWPLMLVGLRTVIERQQDLNICGTAVNQDEALNNVHDMEPDVVLLNLSDKSDSVIHLLKNLKNKHPRVRLIVIANDKDEQSPVRMLRAGAHGHLTSHAKQNILIEAVRRTLHGEIYLDSEATAEMSHWIAERCRPRRAAKFDIGELTNREFEVFCLLGQGKGTLQIAESLGIRFKSAKTYRTQVKRKLGLENQTETLRAAIRYQESIRRRE